MNIYKKENQIIVSLNGCPDGWQNLGFDPSITDENMKYVSGFQNGKAIFDQTRIESDNTSERILLIEKFYTEILEFAEAKCEEGITFKNSVFQCREVDCLRMSSAIRLIELGDTWTDEKWRSRDNKWVPLTAEELRDLALNAGKFFRANFKKARTLVDALGVMSLIDLKNYDVEVAWNAIL